MEGRLPTTETFERDRHARRAGDQVLKLHAVVDGKLTPHGDYDGETDALGDLDALGLTDGLTEALGETLALGDTLGDADGETDALGEVEALGETLTPGTPIGLQTGEALVPLFMYC